ncbi:MAG: SPOR domain-containing protein [Treponema sp.]|jgi:cell division septation protein DedD|nr:SPOR domain-containing protein [Treponema sp.]
MKQNGFVLGVLFLGILTLGASVWEGAAAVSSGGDIPDSGLYAATNSFPRNTVVDVINLETGKTVRVIVVAGLDSPGLLAVVSREAAEALGLQNRSIGRIRMIRPPDPAGSARFYDDRRRSGDPDYDPQAALGKVYREPETEGPGETDSAELSGGDDTDKYQYFEEDYGEGGIADTGEGVPEEGPSVEEAPAVAETPPIAEAPGETPSVTESAGKPAEERAPVAGAGEEYLPPESAWLEPGGESAKTDPAPQGPETAQADPAYDYTYSLVPADERPPSSDLEPDGAYFIDPIPSYGETEKEERGSKGTAENVPKPPSPSLFSVPTVDRLEAGKYYLQIGAYHKTESVKAEIAKMEKSYPLAIQYAGTSENPLYRVLVGPLNQGESGALLRNFKTLGYKDAFIRRGN